MNFTEPGPLGFTYKTNAEGRLEITEIAAAGGARVVGAAASVRIRVAARGAAEGYPVTKVTYRADVWLDFAALHGAKSPNDSGVSRHC